MNHFSHIIYVVASLLMAVLHGVSAPLPEEQFPVPPSFNVMKSLHLERDAAALVTIRGKDGDIQEIDFLEEAATDHFTAEFKEANAACLDPNVILKLGAYEAGEEHRLDVTELPRPCMKVSTRATVHFLGNELGFNGMIYELAQGAGVSFETPDLCFGSLKEDCLQHGYSVNRGGFFIGKDQESYVQFSGDQGCRLPLIRISGFSSSKIGFAYLAGTYNVAEEAVRLFVYGAKDISILERQVKAYV